VHGERGGHLPSFRIKPIHVSQNIPSAKVGTLRSEKSEQRK
jgi:hypothetical protein